MRIYYIALLVSSDPLISSLRPLPKEKLTSLSPEIIYLLKEPDSKSTESRAELMEAEDSESEIETTSESTDESHSESE